MRSRANGCGGTQTDSFARYYTCAVKLNYNGLNICHRYGMYSTVFIYHNKTQTSLNNLTWCLMGIVNMNDQAFTDVTLATLDNQHVRAHKIILSSGSTLFKNILVRYIRGFWCRFLTKIFLEWFDVMSLRYIRGFWCRFLKNITSNHSKNILVRNLHQNPLIYITSNHSKCLTLFIIRQSSTTTKPNKL